MPRSCVWPRLARTTTHRRIRTIPQGGMMETLNNAGALGMRPKRTPLTRAQITGFWGAWAGWTLDGMDSVIYALVMAPALAELLPNSVYQATPAMIGLVGSILFALFLVGWGLSFIWGP